MQKFWSLFSFFAVSFLALPVFAQGHDAGGGSSAAAIAAGLAIGIGALGGALGQGRAAAAALEGIARNPGAQNKIFTPMILGLALIESLVLLSFVIAILLQGKA